MYFKKKKFENYAFPWEENQFFNFSIFQLLGICSIWDMDLKIWKADFF